MNTQSGHRGWFPVARAGADKEANAVKHLLKFSHFFGLAIICAACAKNTQSNAANPSKTVVTVDTKQSPAAAEHSKKLKLVAGQAYAALKAGDDNAAEAFLKQAIEIEPESKLYDGNLADLYVRHGRDKEALPRYRKLFEYNSHASSTLQTDPGILCRYGELCLRLGLEDEAKKAFLRAIGKKDHFGGRYGNPRFNLLTGSPSDIRASATLVAALDTDGERQKKLLRKVYELKPNWEAAKFYFAYFGLDDSHEDCDRGIEIFHSLRNSSDPLVRSIAKESEEAMITWRKQGYKPGPGSTRAIASGRRM